MAATFDATIDEYLAERWGEYPVAASSLGIDGYDDKLTDYSLEAIRRREESEDRWLARFSGVGDDELTPDQHIDRDLIVSTLRGMQIMRDWAVWKRDPATYLGPGLTGVFVLFLHRMRPENELAEAATARLRAVPALLEHGKQNLDPSLANPILVERAIGQCRAGISYARTMVPAEVSDPVDRERLADAGEIAARAYEDFLEHLTKILADASGPYAIGEERYSSLLLEKEKLSYGAREMRERGREAFSMIGADMSKRARDIAGHDDWRALLEELNEDHPPTPESMRDAYEEWTERARQFLLDRGLVTMPDGERCLVEPSPPFQRPVLAVASYSSPPAFKSSLTGHFFVPFPPEGTSDEDVQKRLQTNSYSMIPTIAVHEAYPGHHWHLITAQTNERPIRKVLSTSYFTEGWALYTELMMLQEGFYDDPRHELGVADARIFRAARIVVDTSLHIGDMTVEEAVDFMMKNAGLSEPTARAEVGRYCSWPTQASSYLTGSLEIERMRARYFSEKRGDLRSFHDRLASSGALPMGLAERALMG
ncbi:MAG: DUF885 domain-containing protein [Actinomycetota bacterium]